jgi:two-component system sensor histidine kinase DesK
MVAFRRQILLVRELARARQTVARLAANEERLRLARDLHDLTGHSLSLITLKAELTQRILARLPESPAREALGKELADIEHVSRQTLHDIREAVSGYRRPTLAVEIITARTALEAAGITLAEDSSIIMRSGTFDPQAEAALAWCLREATTNLIRHAGARNCWISLRELDSELALRVVDDGQGPVTTRRDEPAQHGNGLHGMSERLNSVGGRLSTGRAGVGGGFRLVAVVPYRPIEACPHEDGSPASTSPEEREVSRRATEEARGELDRRAPSARPARANVPL